MNAPLWWLAQNTLTVLILLPLVLVTCRLFRHRPAAQHALWVVVLLKFVTPPIVFWPWSLEQALPTAWQSPGSRTTEIVESDGLLDLDGRPLVTEAPLPDADLVGERGSGGDNDAVPSDDGPGGIATVAGIVTPVWLVGMVVSLIRQARRLRRHAGLLRRAGHAPPHLAEEVRAVADQLGLRPPHTVVARGIPSPFVWCLGFLRLVWPEAMVGPAALARSRGVIAHELAHLRRRDHWVAWLELLGAVLYWWNPLFWFVRRRLRETAEMACDALAVATDPAGRREYAEMLLAFSAGFQTGVPAPVLAVSAGTPSSFERRLSMILSRATSGKVSFAGTAVALLFALAALPGWSLGQPAPAGAKPPPATSSPADDSVLRDLIEQGKFVEARARLESLRKQWAAAADQANKAKWTEVLRKPAPAACPGCKPGEANFGAQACRVCHAAAHQPACSAVSEAALAWKGCLTCHRGLDAMTVQSAPREQAPATAVAQIPIRTHAATSVAEALRERFGDLVRAGKLTIVAEERTNAVIVRGLEADLGAVAKWVRQLEANATTDPKAAAPAPTAPAQGTGRDREAEAPLAIIDLGERYLKTAAEYKKAKARVDFARKAAGANAQRDVVEAEIELERAERALGLLHQFVNARRKSADAASDVAAAALKHAEALHKKGLAPASQVEAARERLAEAESRVSQLRSILNLERK